jgi:hypothetical protein
MKILQLRYYDRWKMIRGNNQKINIAPVEIESPKSHGAA